MLQFVFSRQEDCLIDWIYPKEIQADRAKVRFHCHRISALMMEILSLKECCLIDEICPKVIQADRAKVRFQYCHRSGALLVEIISLTRLPFDVD